jgi:carbon-monoxide dehydrogenase large subunit
LRNATRILPGPYHVQSLKVQGEAALSHAAPVTIYRGAGRPEAALLMETLVEMAARQLGMDPVALRLRNLIGPADMPFSTPTGEVLDTGDYPRLMQQTCEKFAYEEERALQARRRQNGECVGIGMALYIEPCGKGWESARVTLQPNGRVEVASGSPAQGQGHLTTFARIAAEELGIDASWVDVLCGDTDTCPPGIGALASRSIAIGGSAIVKACRQARSLQDAGQELPIVVDVRYESEETWSSGCVLVRMAIDPETGHPSVEKVVWVDDAGRLIHPKLVHGQLVGGFAQGFGQAMLEEIVYDGTGQLLTGSLMDYAVPRAEDLPELQIDSHCTPSTTNLLGSKGVGEAGCIGVPAALMNAARDALAPLVGEVQLDFPLRPQRLWQLLQTPVDSHPSQRTQHAI